MNRPSGEHGLTLVELLVTVVLFSIVGMLTTAVLIGMMHTNSYVTANTEDGSALTVAMERMTKELRSAESVMSSSTDKTVTVWVDANRDGYQNPTELITYQLVNGTDGAGRSTVQLRRSTAGSSPTVVAQGLVWQSIFTYSPAPPNTTLLTISLAARSSEGGQQPAQRTVTSEVDIRNR